MKNLYAAFLCILGMLSALTQSQANNYSGRVDSSLSTSAALDNFFAPPPTNDNFASATDITGSINAACTSAGAYTTIGATPDQSKGTCWSNGPNNNVWFKFTATATGFINVQVKVSGAGETQRNPFVAIYDASLTQVACQNYQGAAVDLSLSSLGLIAGNTYYIAVDNYAGYAGSFDLCLSDVPDYDFPVGAKNVTALINAACTSGGIYTTQFATPDHAAGTCWSNGPNNNRWFKFTATATGFINVQVKVSGAGETLRNPFVAIYDASLTQVACQNYQGAAVDLSLSTLGLIAGNTYYIAVDNYAGYAGSFDLCLSDVPDYDFTVGAKNVTALINAACTSGGLYTTQFATPDQTAGTCWSNGPNNNRWFKFTATATGFINVQVKVSGAGETLRNPFVAIYDASLTQVACQNYQGAAVDLSLSTLGLIAGNTYYIAVDNYAGYAGSFDLCLSDVPDYDFPVGAKNVTALINAACTSGGIYTTQFATPDDAKGTCWSNGPNNNRWFKFTATATGFINVQVKVSGAGETLRNPFVAIYDASLTQVACQNYQGAAVDLSLSTLGLIAGNTYYIAVDNYAGYAGSFDLCLSDVPDYDFTVGAKNVTALINAACTSGGLYTTQFATPDQTAGTCWSNGPNNNRWFKFTATATGFINVQVKVSGAGETLRNPFVAIYDASLTQVACQNYQGAAVDLSLSTLGLIAGNTYYIAVDNYAGYAGSFDLCLSDVPDYDFPVGAKNVTALINAACTSGGIYTTQFATPDDAKGTCWSNGPNNNRWFKFTATVSGYMTVQVKVSGAGETLRNPFVAIYDASLTQVACQNYQGAAIDECIGTSGLVPGNTYYIAVDNFAGYAGSFDLCMSDAVPATISYAGGPFCATGTVAVTQTGQAGGVYSSTAGLSINAATGSINLAASTAGTYTVTYTLSIANCVNLYTTTVTINALPVANISYTGSPYCATGNATVTQTGQGGGTYSAPAGLSINAATGAINLGTSTPGIYTVSYAFSNGICNNIKTAPVTINALPVATISYAGSPFCSTGAVAVTRTGQAGGTYAAAPAGLSINAATGAINLATSTTGISYTVTYTFTNGTCGNTTTTTVFVNPLPTVTITNPAAVCAPGTVDLTAAAVTAGSTAGLTYTYYTNAAGTIVLAGPAAVAVSGTYYIKGTTASGCSSIQPVVVTINPKPTVTITNPAAVCSPATVDLTLAAVTAGSTAGLAYTYFTDAAGTLVLAGPNAVAVSGTYYIRGTLATGCSDIKPVVVTINPKPTVVITNPAAVCAPGTVDLTAAAVTAGSTAGLTYTYYTNAAGTIVLAGPAAVAVSGTYYIKGTTASGCSSIQPVVVTINPKPTVTITNPAAVCSPATVDLTLAAVTAGSTAGLAYTYFTDAAGTLVLAGPNAVAVSGTYYIRGTLATGCSDIKPVVVTINPKPTVVITNPAAVCAPGTVDLTAAAVTAGSTAGLIYTYFTDAAGTIVLAGPNAVAVSGTYYIKGTTVSGCSDIKPVVVTINPKPTVVITNPAAVCAPGTVDLTAAAVTAGSTAGLTYTYFTDAAGTIVLAGPAAVAASGTYYIKGTSASGCSDIKPVVVTINPKPTVVITNPAAVCAPGTVDITNAAVTVGSTAGLTYTYFTDAAGTIVLAGPNAVAVSGTYYIKGTTASGCSDIKPVVVTINPKPTVVITNPAAVCSPATVDLTASAVTAGSTAGLIYTYFTDAAGTIVLAGPNAVAVSGTYYIRGTTASGCSDIKPVVVIINPKPTVVITNPAAVCAPGTVDLTAAAVTAGSTAGLTYTYFTDAAGTIVLAGPNAVAAGGTYYIKGTTASGCSDIKPVVVIINPKPAVVITNPAAVCSPATVDLTAAAVTAGSTAGLTFTYFTDAAGTIVLAGPNAVAASGTYYIKGTTASGCSDIKPVVVTINPKPAVVITNPAAVCAPATVDLTAAAVTAGSTAGLTYTYFTDAAGTIVLAGPNAVAASGTYYIKGTTASGCSDIKPVVVTINPKPTVVITNPAAVCAPGTVDLTNAAVTAGSTAGLTFTYFTDAAGTLVLVNANAVSVSGTYYIKGTTASGCSDIKPVVVTINPKPTVVITNPAAVCSPATVDLTASAVTAGSTAGLTFTYFTDAAGTIVLVNANAVSVSGTYYIKGTTASGCSDIKPVVVTINPKPTVVITNPAAVCSPATVDLTASAVTAGSTAGLIYTYFTDAAGTIVLAGPNAVAVSGTYYIRGTLPTGCSDIKPVVVTINPKPTVVITNPAAVCSPATVDLTASAVTAGSTAGLIYTYFTDAAGTIVLAGPNAVAVSGTYYIRGTLPTGCSDIKPVVVTINPKPTVVITNPAAVCSPATVDLTAAAVTAGSTAGLTFTYFTDAAGTIVLAGPNAVAVSGTYYIRGTLPTGCSDIKPVVVTINPKPTVVITNPAAVCSPATVDLTAAAVTAGSTAGLTFTYFTDAAGTIVLVNANAVSVSGTYYIKGTTASGCSDIKPVVVTINPKPTVVITNPAAVCAPGTVDLTNAAVTAGSTAGLTFTYFTDAAGTIVLAGPNAVAVSGTYYIRGTLATGCSDIKPVVVTINPKPTVTITNPAAVCAPGAVDLTAVAVTAGSTAGLTFTYFTDAAGTLVLAGPNAVAVSGTYYIRGTLVTGCSDIKPVVVTINPKPTVVITNPAAVCAPGIVDLTAVAVTAGSTAGLTFTYFTDAAGTLVLAGPNAVAVSGTYYIRGTLVTGCSDIKPVVVTINPKPTVVITNPAAVCAPGTVDLTNAAVTAGSTAGLTYTYFTDAAGTIVLAGPNAVAVSGTYYIRGTLATGCSDIKPVVVTINPKPTVVITNPAAVCAPGIVDLTNVAVTTGSTAGLTYTYFTDAAGTIVLVGPNAVAVSGTYYIRGTTASGCSDIKPVVVIINPKPTVVITNPAAVCSPATVDLTNAAVTAGSTAGLTFTYYTDAAGTIVLANANAVAASGTYYIKGSTASGCSDIKPVVVTINPLPIATISYAGSPYCSTGIATITRTGQAGGTYTAPAGVIINAATGDINLTTSIPGTYNVTYSFSNGTCSSTTLASITINALPVATINYAGSPYCATGTANVTQTGQAGGTYTAAPAGLSINAATGAINLAASTPSATPYTVTYSFGNGTCTNTTTTLISVNALPAVVITNPAAVCAPGTIDLTAAAVTAGSTAGLTFTYFTDAAGTIVLAGPAAVAAGGTYYIRGTLATGCSDIKQVVVTINPKPIVVITNPAAICAPGTVDLTAAAVTAGSTAGLSYTYFTDAAGTIVLAGPNAVAASGTYYIKGTAASGCSDIKPVVVTINPKPIVVITNPAAVCAPATVDLTAAAITAGSTAGLTYTYFTDAAGTIVLAGPNAVAASGTYYIKGATAPGCSDIKSVVVTINPKPTVVITNPAAVCTPGTVDLTVAAVTVGSTAGLTFTYFTDAAGTIVLAGPNAVAASGTYYIQGTTASGCSDIKPVVVTINPKPTVVITNPAAVCAPGTVDLTNAAVTVGSTAGLTYTYFTDAAGTLVLAGPNAVSVSGTYYIRGTLATGCSDIKPVVVTINPKPTVVITNPATVCSPATVDLTAAAVTAGSTAGLIFTYFTDAAGTVVLANANAVTVSGTYYIKGTTGPGCSDIQPVVVTINPKPTVVITNPAAVCSPATVDLTAAAVTAGSTAGLTFTYFTDAAGTIVLAGPNAVAVSGTYYIRGTLVTGCSDIKPVVVTINPKPTVVITNPTAVCAPGTVDLTNAAVTAGSTAGLTYTYFTDAAGTLILAGPAAVAISGTYYIKGTTASGCSDIKPVVVTINPKPTVVITNPAAVCSPATVDLTNAAVTAGSTAGLTYTYFSDAAGTIVLANANAVAASGTYYIKGSTASGCSDINPVVVTINPKPTVAITNPAAVCSPSTVDLTVAAVTAGSTAGLTYTYFTDAAGTIVLANANAVAASGTYYIKGTTVSGCSDIQPVVVTINPKPTVIITNPAAVCAPGTVDLTVAAVTAGSTAGLTFTYYTDAAGTIILANANAVSASGTYYIKGSAVSGCSDIQPVIVTINPLPIATIVYSGTPYCATGTATITQTGQTGGTYSSTPAGLSLNTSTGTVNLATSTPGLYSVTYSFSNGTCSDTRSTPINIITTPVVVITNPAAACTPGTVDLTAPAITAGSTAGLTYTYFTDAAGTIVLAAPNAVTVSGTYYIKGSAGSGCSDIKPVIVIINPKPTVVITNPASVCSPSTVDLTNAAVTAGSTAGLTYAYFTDAAGTVVLANANAVSVTGTYYVKGTTASGCSDIQPVLVTINPLPVATIAYTATPYCTTGTANVTLTGQTGGAFTAPAAVSIDPVTGVINLAGSTPGTYTVSYSFSNGTCSNTTTASITINALPIATINYPGSPYCATGTAAVTQSGQAGGNYSSTAGLVIDPITGTINLAASTPNAAPYTITYAFTNGTCSSTTTASVLINALPTVSITNPAAVCVPGTVDLTNAAVTAGSTAGLTFTYFTDAAGTLVLANANAVTVSGTYYIKGTTASGCSDIKPVVATINPKPTVVITNPAAVCTPGTVDLTNAAVTAGSTAGLTFTYFTDAAGTLVLANANAVAASGTYYIKGTTASGCSDIKPVVVTINPKPTVVITNPPAVCAPGTVDLTNAAVTAGSTAGLTFTYFTDAAGTLVLANANAVTVGGTYYIEGTTASGCSDIKPVIVTINPLPAAAIAYNGSPYCATGTAVVTQTGQAGGTYSAPAGVIINAATGDINLVTSAPGTYSITYSFSNGTCSSTASAPVTINALPTAVISYTGSPYCATGTAVVTQTGQAGGTYSSVPAGLSINAVSGAINLTASTPSAAPYTITYSFGNGICTNTTTTAILVNPLPAVVITNPAAICAPGTVDITAAGVTAGSTPGLIYTYFTDAAGTIVLANANSVAVSGSYYIRGTTASGCSDIKPVVVTINPLPAATIAYTGSPYCATGTAAVTQTGQAGGTYSAPAAVSIDAVTGAVNLATSTPGTYTVTYTFTNGTCSNTTTTPITINALPTAVINYAGSPYCATGTANVTQTGQAGGTYSSTAGLVIDPVTGAIDLGATTPNSYTITYTFTNGTCSNTTQTNVTVLVQPVVLVTNPPAVCAPATVDLTAASVIAGSTAGLTFTYFTDAAGTIILANANAVSINGTYYIKGTTASGCSDIEPVVVTINPKPTVVITNPAAICAPGTVDLTAAAVTAGSTAGLSYTYFTDAAGTLILAGPAVVAISGTYYIKGTTASGCSDIQPVTVTINPNPTIVITNPAAVCSPATVDITAAAVTSGSTAGLTYTYFTDAAGTVVLANANALAVGGTYFIKGSSASGCSDIQPVIVTINPKPTVVITNPAAACSPGTTDLTAPAITSGSTTGLVYTYFTDAAGTIVLANANAVSVSGTYYIRGTSATGCSDIQPVIVTINPKPTVVITNPAAVCAPGTVDLTSATVTAGSTAGLTYTYFTDILGTVVLPNANAVTVSGIYYIKGTTASGCSDIQPVVVTINPLPVATIAYTGSPYCATGTAAVTQTGQIGGTYSAPPAVSIDPVTGMINLATSTPGIYTVTYTFSNGTCSNATSAPVTINALPTATINYAGSPYCATGTANVTQAGQPGGNYSSAAGLVIDPVTGTINLSASTSSASPYTVTYSFGNGTCNNTTQTNVTVLALPVVLITNPLAVCAPGTVDLTAAGVTAGSTAGLTYTYFADAAGTIVLANANAIAASGTYYIKGTTAAGCSDIRPVVVTINPKPTVVVANPAGVCSPATIDLTAAAVTAGSTAGLTFTYFTDAAGTITLANANAVTVSGTYYIRGTAASGCSDIQPVVVTINPKPTVVIANPAAVCSPATIDLTAAAVTAGSTAGLTFTYFTDAAGTIALPNANAVTVSGTYYISGTTASGCSDIKPVIVTINPKPSVVITNPAAVCSPATIDITTAAVTTGSTAGLIYSYFSDAGGTIVLANANAIAVSGTYYIMGTTALGCADIQPVVVTINLLPVAIISYAASPYCATGTATVTQTGQAGGTYSSTAGLSITAATGDIDLTTSTAGVYTVTYSFSNGTCNNSTTASVTINALPTATIAYLASPYCATGTAVVTQSGVSGGFYSAPAGVSIDALTGAINLSASSPGIYTVTYSYSNGTCSNTASAPITINALPSATIFYAGSPYCATGTAIVNQAGQSGGVYSSTVGLIIDAATGDIDLAASTPGLYTVTYSFTNGTCSNTTTANVMINALPIANISYAGSPYCAAGTAAVTLTGQSGGTYSSTAGLVINSATGDVDLVASTPGSYLVTYTFSNGTCGNTTTANITTIALPALTITNPPPACTPSTVDITSAAVTAGSTAGLTYTYFTDAAGTINLSNPNAVAVSGTYYIRGTAASGCSNIQPVIVSVNAKPTVVINNPAPVCAPSTVDITTAAITAGSTAGLTFTYFTDAAGTVSLANANAVAAGGTYYVEGTTISGCSDIQPVVVTINAQPSATIIYAGTPYCTTGTATVTLTGQAGGFYNAPAAVSLNAVTGDINLAASTPGIYTVTYTFSNGICSNSTTASISINPLPTVAITNPAAVCAPLTVNLTKPAVTAGSTPGLVYTYFRDVAGTVILSNPAVVTASGTYYIRGTNGTGCSDIKPVVVTVNPLPFAGITYTGSPYCTNGVAIVSLTGTGGGTFASSPGLSLNTSTGDINLAASTVGTYIVSYSFTNGTCSNSVTTQVTIRNPLLVINNPAGVCFPSTIDLTNSAVTAGSQAGLSFSYYQDNAGTIPLPNPAAVGTAGIYYIMGTDLTTGCSSGIQPVVVSILAKPTISASSSDTNICKGTMITLTASSPGNTIDWPGLGTGNVVTATPLTNTTYLAVATTANGCMDTATVNILVTPFILTLTANPDPVLAGTNTTITTGGNFTYNVLSWSPAVLFTDQTATTQNLVVNDTTKSFTVIAQSTAGCLDTATLDVVVDANLKDFFIPNSFSPNNDGNNDIFKVYGTSVRDVVLRVYNQWGELIFESENAQNGWDGTWKGRPQAVGVYVYVAQVTFYNNVKIKRKGTVNLIR